MTSNIKIKNIVFFILIFLSLVFASWQVIYLAQHESITTDEKVHAPSGFSYWKFGNFYLNPEHPPLAKLLVGLPAYLERPFYPNTTKLFQVATSFYYDSWSETRQWGEQFFYNSGNNAEKIIFTSRAVNIVLTLGLIIFLSIWAFQIAGWPAAALAAILAAFTPLFLAHGSLANTDVLITVGFTLLSYVWWRYLKEKSWKWFITSAVIFGVCALSKFSFVAFIPVLFLTSLVVAIKDKKIGILSAILKALIFSVIVWFMILAFYGFSFEHAPAFIGFTQKGLLLNTLAIKIMEVFGQVLVPVWYFKGLFMVLGGAVGGRGAYLLGHFTSTGWWYYFPIAIAVKTSVGFLALTIWASAYLKKLLKNDFALQVVLLGGALIYLIVTMISKTNLGLRHIMPIFPLLIIFVSQLVLLVKKRWQIILLTVFVLVMVLSTLQNYKNQIAYFNEFTGTKNGYKYLLDSNYDWGQSLTSIRDYLNQNKFEENVYLSYEWMSPGEKEYYGIATADISEFNPNRDALIIVDPGTYMKPKNSWLRNLPVVDRIDNTIFVLKYNRSAGDN